MEESDSLLYLLLINRHFYIQLLDTHVVYVLYRVFIMYMDIYTVYYLKITFGIFLISLLDFAGFCIMECKYHRV